ncbi:hypothetical protein CI109_101348 [Kwoniella shandongensis]|uniref:Uncharacterized protein n=1 Tax=Kwoniella shandongensis TaxID=1734106 RepID=A0A5M6BU18_9TREE|nr:uncharacterized protein CI109_005273 [Kwoniella shandongensis]KAA5526317.1 hypothetical protein CI109_005273 [Kwoniella shandongensis]
MTLDTLTYDLVDRAQRTHNHLSYRSPYGYTPSRSAGIAYIVVFAILLLVHVGLGVRYRYWLVFATLVPGTLLEVLGWAGRLWSYYSVLKVTPFLMQISTLIIAPAFFSAWAYTVLGYCITRLGPAYSLLSPRMYLAVFVTADIISLVVQAIGGGKAAVAAQQGTPTGPATKIMLAGILFQLATMTIFIVLATDFIFRVIARKPYAHLQKKLATTTTTTAAPGEVEVESYSANDENKTTGRHAGGVVDLSASGGRTEEIKKVEKLLAGVAFASAMIFVRGIYRSIELAQGWTGYLITHESYFIYLDGLPMVLCLAAFVVSHPGWLLPRRQGWLRA